MQFVCCHFESLEDQELLAELPQLYAHPYVPRLHRSRSPFIILDSGAWGLAQRGQKMGHSYMAKLAIYYRGINKATLRPVAHCIAPDVYLNPAATMNNWIQWHEVRPQIKVCPVIQFEKEKCLDYYSALQQAEFYGRYSRHFDFVAISNPGLRALEAGAMPEIAAAVRGTTGAKWLHCLGAGWSPQDIQQWRKLKCFDSIDSVSYYTDAKNKRKWRLDGKIDTARDVPWRELAAHNGVVAYNIATVTEHNWVCDL